jgi:ubiquinone/menaquinone biosynthesis C-methylase UbiE
MLNISKEDFPIGEKKTGYFSADARKIPLKNDSVDLVFCHRYLNHIDNSDERRMIMSELARVSRRYVAVSCLGAPSFIRFIRHHWYLLTGITTQDESIAVSQLVESAIQAGLKLQTKTPISPMISSAVFLTFTK